MGLDGWAAVIVLLLVPLLRFVSVGMAVSIRRGGSVGNDGMMVGKVVVMVV